MKKLLLGLMLLFSLTLVACEKGETVTYVDSPRFSQVKVTVSEQRGSINVFILAENKEAVIDYIVLAESKTIASKEALLSEANPIGKGQNKGSVNKVFSDLEDDTTYYVYAVITLNDLVSDVLTFDAKTMTEIEFLIKGTGVEEDPFLIDSAWQLAAIMTDLYGYTNTAHYLLVDDIDLHAEGFQNWVPLGAQDGNSRRFNGVFNGNGYTISNLTIKTTAGTEKWGLFREIDVDGLVYNINFDKVDISVEGFRVGTLVGYSKGTSWGIHVTNANIVQPSGEGQIGGIVGAFYDTGSLQRSSYIGNVTAAGRRVGGIVGAATTNGGHDLVNLSDLYFEGEVKGTTAAARQVGGIVGNGTKVKLTNSVAKGKVSGVRQVGGIIGYTEGDNALPTDLSTLLFVGDLVHSDASEGNANTSGTGAILGDRSGTEGKNVVTLSSNYSLDTVVIDGTLSSRTEHGEIITIEELTLEFYAEFMPNLNTEVFWDVSGTHPVLRKAGQ